MKEVKFSSLLEINDETQFQNQSQRIVQQTEVVQSKLCAFGGVKKSHPVTFRALLSEQ